MSKRQILGVAGLLGAVAIPLNYNIFINCGQAAAENIFAAEKQALETSVERASEVLEQAREAEKQKTVESQTYPGLAGYVEKLIDDTKKYPVNADMIDALDEASEAIPYLLGLNRTQTVGVERKETTTQSKVATYSRTSDAEKVAVASEPKVAPVEVSPETKPQQVAQTGVKVEVKSETVKSTETVNVPTEVAPVEQSDEKSVEVQSEAEKNEEVLELPKTGATEEKKISVAGLIIAGVTVVVATITGAVAVVVSKRKN